jgi:hypothetical protein
VEFSFGIDYFFSACTCQTDHPSTSIVHLHNFATCATYTRIFPAKKTPSKHKDKCQTHLSIVDHVDTPVGNTLGMVAKKLENVLHLRLVRKATETDAILADASRYDLLRKQRELRDGWWNRQRRLGSSHRSRDLSLLVQRTGVHRSVQDLNK